ncbi:MAG TPA: 50S ribosomal protein L11 methyltransferase [Rhodothermales bacterium]|nr:50S ribosomal protein L11 methyltransferase [Rhodothermales bacterium]
MKKVSPQMERISLFVFPAEGEVLENWVHTLAQLGWQHPYSTTAYASASVFRTDWEGTFANHTFQTLTRFVQARRLLDWYIQGEESPVQWEVFYRPVSAGDFCVLPDWLHPKPDTLAPHHLFLKQSLSFGTAQHPATRMLLRMLPKYLKADDVVADIGTGTGILAIAALRCGAAFVWCSDLHEWMAEELRHNLLLNQCPPENIHFTTKTPQDFPQKHFAVVLSNISAAFHLENVHELTSMLSLGGHLIVSGIKEPEAKEVLGAFMFSGLKQVQAEVEEGWWSGVFTPS